MREKCCSQCHHTKPVRDFGRSRNSPDGRQENCQACVRTMRYDKKALREMLGVPPKAQQSPAARLKATYGLDKATYDAMLEEQNHRCAICGSLEILVVDHDHRLEKLGPRAIRGLLCPSCNLGLGSFRDNPKSLRSAIKYLQAFQLKQSDAL